METKKTNTPPSFFVFMDGLRLVSVFLDTEASCRPELKTSRGGGGSEKKQLPRSFSEGNGGDEGGESGLGGVF